MRVVMIMVVLALVLVPVAVSADSIFLPTLQSGVRDWFTVADVLRWSSEAHNVMPIYCTESAPGIFTTCTVVQAQPLTLTWDNELGKVVAQ
jgi:hypothetical protein